MQKIQPNKRQNTLKRISNREIESLENNFRVKATKNIINTPKTAIEKLQIVSEPKITSPKIAAKPKKLSNQKLLINWK